jgi:hypothetical protein
MAAFLQNRSNKLVFETGWKSQSWVAATAQEWGIGQGLNGREGQLLPSFARRSSLSPRMATKA